MGISRKGWSVSRCRSPVIMQAACEATANSRIMLSSGSLQTVIFSVTVNVTAYFSMTPITLALSAAVKYLSNFLRMSTAKNSLIKESEIPTIPLAIAFLKARSLGESLIRKALINAFVLRTSTLRFFTQCLIQLFLGKSASSHALANHQ